LEGQRLEVLDLTAGLMEGAVSVAGEYMIIDGDFDVDLALGEPDPDQDFERVHGVNLVSVVPESVHRFVDGELTGALNVRSDDGRMSVRLDEPLVLELAEPLPYGGARLVELSHDDEGEGELVVWHNRILRVGSDTVVKLGGDALSIGGGATMFVD